MSQPSLPAPLSPSKKQSWCLGSELSPGRPVLNEPSSLSAGPVHSISRLSILPSLSLSMQSEHCGAPATGPPMHCGGVAASAVGPPLPSGLFIASPVSPPPPPPLPPQPKASVAMHVKTSSRFISFPLVGELVG